VFWVVSNRVPVAAILCFSALPLTGADPTEARRALTEGQRLGWIYNWTQARPQFEKAEKLYAEAGDARNALFAKIGRLRGEWETLSFPDVSQYLATELLTPLVQEDPDLRLWLLEAKGSLDLEIEPASARRAWEQVRELATELGETARASRATGELGIIAYLEGDSATALELVAKALANSVAQEDIGAHIRYLVLMGNGLSIIGRHEDGIGYFDRALRTARSHPDLGTSVTALTAKARALIELAKYPEARKLLNEALRIARRNDRRGNQAELLLVLADLETHQDNHQEAIRSALNAAELADAGKFHRLYAGAMFQLADLYRKVGDLAKAEECAATGLRSARIVGDVYSLPESIATLAELQRSRGRFEEADALYEQATDVLDGLLLKSGSVRSKTSLIGARSRIYVDHFMLAANELADLDKAFRTIERARGRTTADTLRMPVDELPEPSPERLALEEEISRLQLRLMRNDNRDERKLLLDQLFAGEQKLGPLPAGRDRALAIGEPVDLKSIQRNLAPDELVLEYVLDDPTSVCLVIGRDEFHAVQLTRKSRIESLVEVFLAEVRSKRSANEVASELYKELLGPISEHREKKRLIVIPDDRLHLLPFDALRAPDGRRVLETRIVSYAPSATVLHLLRNSPHPAPNLPLLAIGDVRYKDSEMLAASKSSAEDKDSNGLDSGRVRGVFDLEAAKFTELPSTAEEVASVAKVAGVDSVLLVAEGATETALKTKPLDRFRVLHLAVHGIADAEFPHRAALVLGADLESGQDGLLQVREIITLSLAAELVTLSACDTAAGRLEGQEGITNLVTAFLVAGARTAVASLWAADDVFTTSLMRRFYGQLAAGEDRASALRTAKLEMIERFGDQAVPFYWAGFIMVGDGSRPIQWTSGSKGQ